MSSLCRSRAAKQKAAFEVVWMFFTALDYYDQQFGPGAVGVDTQIGPSIFHFSLFSSVFTLQLSPCTSAPASLAQ